MKNLVPLFCLCALISQGADLPPDAGKDIPASGKREQVIKGKSALALPKHDLDEGYALEVAAAAPLVTHPIMGCLDDRGRLFVGDAVGVNWNKKQLEENPPNRVLMLEDTDADGAYDKSTIFADKMTFPQGACWLKGSLYVCSPPGLWKLTDTDDDGIADQREMIVGGFEYTGNAADVHGPFLHPKGRLYWCHGRKGHKVTQKDGTLVDESLASGIWSCNPDGSDVAWHSLGCGDNPVEVDFTPDGDVIGVQNLYYSQPRGDTLIHWLKGGVYERPDQLKAIAHLSRTLETIPVMFNFGHVAVSGCCFWKSYPVAKTDTHHFLVTHFNTQRLVRMELTPQGGTYRAVENEFLKLHNPDIHLTDVMEDPRDGSLLLIDTGGWFRIGCPSSLMAKSDLLGAVYRIRPKKAQPALPVAAMKSTNLLDDLRSSDFQRKRRALEKMAEAEKPDGEIMTALGHLLDQELDPPTEHALIHALQNLPPPFHSGPASDLRMSRWLIIESSRMAKSDAFATTVQSILSRLDPGKSQPLTDAVRRSLEVIPNGAEIASKVFSEWLDHGNVDASKRRFITQVTSAKMSDPAAKKTVTAMLGHAASDVRGAALEMLSTQTFGVSDDAWLPSLEKALRESVSPTLLDAIKRLKSPRFDSALMAIANDPARQLPMRLKALDSCRTIKLEGETFDQVSGVLANPAASSSAKIQAASMLASAPLTPTQIRAASPLLASVGPIELKSLLPLLKKHKDADLTRELARQIAKNPAIASQQESAYRTALADLPPDIFEDILLPAYNTATAATEQKKRLLAPLSERVVSSGDISRGESHFKAGKGTCIACHQVGGVGRPIGPDLSKIGAIRTERDLLESILFPSNTLARDYEAHVIETSDGQQTLGVVRSHTAEGLLVVDIAGQEKTIAHSAITGDTMLPTSLMPMGLDQTLPESELLDLVAWLRSLR